MKTVLVLKHAVVLNKDDRIFTNVLRVESSHVDLIKSIQKGLPFVPVHMGSLRAVASSNIVAIYEENEDETLLFTEETADVTPPPEDKVAAAKALAASKK